MDKRQEFLKKLLRTFRIEAEENLKNMTMNLMKLEKKPSDSVTAELIEIIFREAHSLKGSSRAVNLLEIESVAHSFESVLSVLKNKTIEVNLKIFDVMHQTIDLIDELLNSKEDELNAKLKKRIYEVKRNLSMIEAGKSEEINVTIPLAVEPETELITPSHIEQEKVNIKKATKIKVSTSLSAEETDTSNFESVEGNITLKPDSKNLKYEQSRSMNPTSETIRVSTKKLDHLLFQAEEMLSLKLTAIQQNENLRIILDKIRILKDESYKIIDSTKNITQTLENKEKTGAISKEEKDIIKIIQFYDWGISSLITLEEDLESLRKFSVQEAYSSGVKIETLLEDVKEIITVPFSMLLDVFPKAVRDISKDLGKEVDFIVKGDDTEIDRRILESIRQPLMHIVRNCIDYGIEKPDVRIKKNKVKKGSILCNIERLENSKVLIKISDDGAGINFDKLRNLYIINEGLSKEDALKIKDKELLNYIFKSGISTGEIVTDMSGRGLGLAIVQEKIDQLGGAITVESEKDKGTIFKIELPLSLVTFRGVLIKVSNREFVVPTAKIQRAVRINQKELKTVENKATILFDEQIIPFVNLSNILELPLKETDSEYIQTLIFKSNGEKIGFAIDEIIGEQEVLVKNFNKHLTRVRNISGATILGSGKVVPILNIFDLVKSANKSAGMTIRQKVTKDIDKEQLSVLVVEDSITSRMLLKNILESAGYSVTTAIDGMDGFTKLKESTFNIVVSDVEMPRMNGLDLTAKIRADKVLSDLPVVLVTSLSKRDDREKGIDVGANAYIVKSDFDQSNLLDILEQLL